MLRNIFVFVVLAIASTFAVRSALYAASLYLWIAYFRPETWAGTGDIATLNLSYYAGVFLVVRTILAGVSLKPTWRNAMLLLFLALTLVSTLSSPHVNDTWALWQAFAKTIIVSYLLAVIIKTEADFRLILFVIALSLGFEAGKQGWVGLILNPGDENPNFIPFLGDNNLVAVGMAMLIPVVSSLAQTSSNWQKRALQALNIGLVYRAVSTYSRGGFLAISAVAGLAFWRSAHKARTIGAAVIIVALVLPAMPQRFWDRMSTIIAATDVEQRDDSQASRLYFWQVAVAMANDHPYLGIGHSVYEVLYDEYDTTKGRYGRRRAVHSAWFGVLAETGYIGLALFVAIVLSSLVACHRVRRMAGRSEIPPSFGRYAAGLESAMVAFMVGGSFVSFQYSEMLWHFFALTIALDRAAAVQAALVREQRARETQPVTVQEPAEEFVWA